MSIPQPGRPHRQEPLAEVFARVVGPDTPVRFEAYDGSTAGPADAAVRLDVRTPEAVSYLITSPGDLGVARAYISGALDVHGDIYTVLRTLSAEVGDLTIAERFDVLRSLGPGFLKRVEPPPEENRLSGWRNGWRHSKRRDGTAISHHYDVSNRFYESVLGPSMAYTCAVYPRADATLEEAQFEKFDLVCRKLALEPGRSLLDVGCGWGGMVLHAARHYGVRALGVTLSRQQAEWAQKAIVEAGLADLAEVRHLDYRDVRKTGFDAVSSIGLTEHIGARNLPAYFRFLRGRLRPGGRLLNHCITRPTTTEPVRPGGFISRYVFPDGELEAVGRVISEMQNAGLEVRHEENLREHYARTCAAWCDNLAAHWDEAVEEAGLARAKVWMLYMAGSRLGFEQRKIELHQVLAVNTVGGSNGMPLRPDW